MKIHRYDKLTYQELVKKYNSNISFNIHARNIRGSLKRYAKYRMKEFNNNDFKRNDSGNYYSHFTYRELIKLFNNPHKRTDRGHVKGYAKKLPEYNEKDFQTRHISEFAKFTYKELLDKYDSSEKCKFRSQVKGYAKRFPEYNEKDFKKKHHKHKHKYDRFNYKQLLEKFNIGRGRQRHCLKAYAKRLSNYNEKDFKIIKYKNPVYLRLTYQELINKFNSSHSQNIKGHAKNFRSEYNEKDFKNKKFYKSKKSKKYCCIYRNFTYQELINKFNEKTITKGQQIRIKDCAKHLPEYNENNFIIKERYRSLTGKLFLSYKNCNYQEIVNARNNSYNYGLRKRLKKLALKKFKTKFKLYDFPHAETGDLTFKCLNDRPNLMQVVPEPNPNEF